MAWNYEKGCEEPAPYSSPSGIWTPSPELTNVAALYLHWQSLETGLAKLPKTMTTQYRVTNEAALGTFHRLESAMLREKGFTVSEFRRRYIEYIEKEKELLADQKARQAVPDMNLEEVDLNSLSVLERIIVAGYRQLAKQTHPDAGGSNEKFAEIQAGMKQLRAILREVKDAL